MARIVTLAGIRILKKGPAQKECTGEKNGSGIWANKRSKRVFRQVWIQKNVAKWNTYWDKRVFLALSKKGAMHLLWKLCQQFSPNLKGSRSWQWPPPSTYTPARVNLEWSEPAKLLPGKCRGIQLQRMRSSHERVGHGVVANMMLNITISTSIVQD